MHCNLAQTDIWSPPKQWKYILYRSSHLAIGAEFWFQQYLKRLCFESSNISSFNSYVAMLARRSFAWSKRSYSKRIRHSQGHCKYLYNMNYFCIGNTAVDFVTNFIFLWFWQEKYYNNKIATGHMSWTLNVVTR